MNAVTVLASLKTTHQYLLAPVKTSIAISDYWLCLCMCAQAEVKYHAVTGIVVHFHGDQGIPIPLLLSVSLIVFISISK